MGTDAFLDLDVIARSPEPYRLLGQLGFEDLYRMLRTLAQAEASTTVAERVHQDARFIRPILELVPALKGALDLDDLARRWGTFKFDRQAELLHLSLLLPRMEPKEFIGVEGVEHLKDAFDRGAPFLTPIHAGPFQLIPFVLARMGNPVATFMEADSVALWREIGLALMDAADSDLYARIIPVPLPSARAPRDAIRFNRGGFSVLTFPEFTMGEPPKRTIRFLGAEVLAVDGVARMAWLNKRDMLPLTFRSYGNGRYLLRFYPPIRLAGKEDIFAATAAFYHWLEQRVLEEPHAWLSWAFFKSHMLAPLAEEPASFAD
ncbi:LpxL/LpxP family acyltransferase [Oceanithermus sp.]